MDPHSVNSAADRDGEFTRVDDVHPHSAVSPCRTLVASSQLTASVCPSPFDDENPSVRWRTFKTMI